MKQITINENARSVSGATLAGHIFSLTSSAFTASGTSVTITAPTLKVKYNTNANSRNALSDSVAVTPKINNVSGADHGYYTSGSYKLAYNTDKTLSTSDGNWSYTTSTLFNANNKTTKTLSINWVIAVKDGRIISTGTSSDGVSLSSVAYAESGSGTISAEGSVTLNAPPTFSATTTSTGAYYANRSKYTVNVASLSAKYGGTISSAVLTVGSATASRTTNGVLEVTVPNAGTYTPSVKVTDSRGQVTTQNLTAITVTAHTSPALTATVTSSAPYYNAETVYSVAVSDIATYEGSTVSSIVLKIGSQTTSRTDAGALSIATNTAGTFTPTVTINDSFGDSTVYSMPPITVNPYVAPALSFDIQRTLPKTGELTPIGKPDDEGESAVATATFNWTSAIADLVAPTVVATDPDGDPVTITADWYKTRASDGTLSDLISDWSTITTSDMPVYGLISNSNHNAFNTQYSYQIAITPSDDTSTGITISQTLGSAFYTVDFLAGGHGIAFGQPASEEGFVVNLDSTFNKAVYIELPNYQTADELDREIYDSIVALGWDADCLGS